MQLPTHVIAGILIQYIIMDIFPALDWLTVILIASCALLSHFVLDSLARATYHPPNRLNENFWLTWHLVVYTIGILLVIIFIWYYWLGIIFANLPDLWDWYTLRPIANKKQNPDWGKKYYIHNLVTKFRNYFFGWVPDYTLKRWGVIPETIVFFLWFIFILLNGPQLLQW